MVSWDKVLVEVNKGDTANAIAPVIVSASRSTDIPACYARWFMHRFLEAGSLVWTNPFNRSQTIISFQKTRAIVFWTKYAQPIEPYLGQIEDRGVDYYFQYTLNDYEDLGYEPNIPPIDERIADFKGLSARIGKSRTIWRFDPIIFSKELDVDSVLQRLKCVGDAISDYTERLVFSFIDLQCYKKLRRPARENNLRELSSTDISDIAEGIRNLNRRWNLELFTCGEAVFLDDFGIRKGKCVDGDLMLRLFPNNVELVSFIQCHNKKDKGQRVSCGCIPSKDIGEYNTCPNLCIYCYANSSRDIVMKNIGGAQQEPAR